jgi:hypothetical protein
LTIILSSLIQTSSAKGKKLLFIASPKKVKKRVQLGLGCKPDIELRISRTCLFTGEIYTFSWIFGIVKLSFTFSPRKRRKVLLFSPLRAGTSYL